LVNHPFPPWAKTVVVAASKRTEIKLARNVKMFSGGVLIFYRNFITGFEMVVVQKFYGPGTSAMMPLVWTEFTPRKRGAEADSRAVKIDQRRLTSAATIFLDASAL
jgi:hypothetical protein